MVGTNTYLLLIVSVCVGATPHRRSEDCMAGSQALKAVLDRHDEWYRFVQFDERVTFEYVYETITGTTLDEFPEDFFCAFTGLTSVDGLLAKLHQFGIIQAPFEALFNSACGSCMMIHTFIQLELDDPSPWTNVTELRIYEQLLADLIASGIVTVDPEGFLWPFAFFSISISEGHPDYSTTPDYISTEPLSVQANDIANDIQKVWDMVVQHIGPGGNRYLRDEIKRWTGVALGKGSNAHYTILLVVRTILATVEADDPIAELLDILYYNDVIGHTMRAAYPDVVYVLSKHEEYVQNMDESSFSPISQEIMELSMQVIQALRNMGLMNLSVN